MSRAYKNRKKRPSLESLTGRYPVRHTPPMHDFPRPTMSVSDIDADARLDCGKPLIFRGHLFDCPLDVGHSGPCRLLEESDG